MSFFERETKFVLFLQSSLLALISEKPQLKKVHLTLADLVRCNDWCLRIMQTHHAVTNYFMGPGQFFPHPPQPPVLSCSKVSPVSDWCRRPSPHPASLLPPDPPSASDFLSSVLSQRVSTTDKAR